MAVDLAEFHKLSKPKRKPCRIAIALETLGPKSEPAQQLTAALATDNGIITGAAIEAWCKARDLDVSQSSVTSHRRGKCSCSDA